MQELFLKIFLEPLETQRLKRAEVLSRNVNGLNIHKFLQVSKR